MPFAVRPVLCTCAALIVLAAPRPAHAASDHWSGDGSEADIPALRDGFATSDFVAEDAPREPYAPFFTTESSLGLRGSFVRDKDGGHFETIVAPAVSLTHEGVRQNLSFEADAEIAKTSGEGARIAALNVAAATEYAINQWTSLTASGALSLTQDSVASGGADSGIALEPIIVSGEGDIELSRQFGRFVLAARGQAGRSVTGPTTLDDYTIEDNSADNVTSFGGGLRLGFEVSPRVTLFADLGSERQVFDLPSPTQLVHLDGTTTILSAGATAQWGRFIDVEGAIGVGVHQSDAPGIPDVASMLYSARVSYTPDETFSLSGEFASSLGPPASDSEGAAEVTYEASAEARYVVNDWLAVRAAAGWSSSSAAGTTESEDSHGIGVGVDYLFNSHATLSADYAFERSTTSPDPAEDTHRVTLGLTLSN